MLIFWNPKIHKVEFSHYKVRKVALIKLCFLNLLVSYKNSGTDSEFKGWFYEFYFRNTAYCPQLSLYLFKELPLQLWKPIEQDLSIISHWLLECPISSIENQLARQILTNLNWGCEGRGPHGGILSLPLELHQRVAILVVEAALRFTPDTVSAAGAGMITESVKQV